MNTKLISNLILFFHISPDAIKCHLFVQVWMLLTLVLKIKLVHSCYPIIINVCFIN